MAFLEISSVCKSFGGNGVLDDVDLSIERGEFVVFINPSGGGKSTLLRRICGLETISSGTIAIEGEAVNDVDPAARGTAMVFQSYALYAHMTTFQNLSFWLRMAHRPRDSTADKVNKGAAILKLDKLLDLGARLAAGAPIAAIGAGVGAHGCDDAEDCRAFRDALAARTSIPLSVINDAELMPLAFGMTGQIGVVARHFDECDARGEPLVEAVFASLRVPAIPRLGSNSDRPAFRRRRRPPCQRGVQGRRGFGPGRADHPRGRGWRWSASLPC